MQLVALSADPLVDDSDMSPVLYIDTDTTEKSHYVPARAIDSMNTIVEKNEEGEMEEEDEEYYSELKVRVVSVSEDSIHIDWLMYTELPTMSHYKVTWNSVGQPAVSRNMVIVSHSICLSLSLPLSTSLFRSLSPYPSLPTSLPPSFFPDLPFSIPSPPFLPPSISRSSPSAFFPPSLSPSLHPSPSLLLSTSILLHPSIPLPPSPPSYLYDTNMDIVNAYNSMHNTVKNKIVAYF